MDKRLRDGEMAGGRFGPGLAPWSLAAAIPGDCGGKGCSLGVDVEIGSRCLI